MQTDVFKAADRQILFRKFGAGMIVDFVLVMLFLNITKSDYSGPLDIGDYLLGIGLLWAVQLALWLKGLVAAWLALMLEHGAMTTQFLEVLRTTKIPPPKQFNCPARFDYLIQLADIEDADPSDRVKAAGVYCSWQGIMKLRGVAATIVINRAWDEAIDRYNRESPNPL